MSDTPTVWERLAEPFPIGEIEFRAGAVSGNRALALGYIDARVVMDRLDAVCGPNNWQDHYREMPNGCIVCTLSLRVENEWLSKEDVGGPSDQKDIGDHTKAAYSDALKRAAVKWGIGRYLYSLPAVWVDYDPQKKQLLKTPQLPDWAMPEKKNGSPAKPQAAPQSPPASPGQKRWNDLVAEAGPRKWRLQQLWATTRTDHQATDQVTTEQYDYLHRHLIALEQFREEPPLNLKEWNLWVTEMEAEVEQRGVARTALADSLSAAMTEQGWPRRTEEWTAGHMQESWKFIKAEARALISKAQGASR